MSTNDGRLKWNEYQRKGQTYTESLSDKEIAEKLENYEEVTDIDYVPINTHVRYFVQDKETAKWKFRLGGFLKKKDNPKYIVLSTSPNLNGKTWSVSRDGAVFFKILPPKEEENISSNPNIGQSAKPKLSNQRYFKPKELERDNLIEQYQKELKNKNSEVEILKTELIKMQNQMNLLLKEKSSTQGSDTKIILAKSKKIPKTAKLATRK